MEDDEAEDDDNSPSIMHGVHEPSLSGTLKPPGTAGGGHRSFTNQVNFLTPAIDKSDKALSGSGSKGEFQIAA